MQFGLSTHIFLPHRLQTSHLETLRRAGSTVIEIFAARFHFDYTDRSAVRDLASWFRDSGVEPRLHAPLTQDTRWSRHMETSLSLLDPDKSRRIDAMDEIRRALDAAEQIPFRTATLHLGLRGDPWSPRAFEHALTAIEHLRAFARPLGVGLLLENLENEVTTPDHLLEILSAGHFDDVGLTLDVGHAHLTSAHGTTPSLDQALPLLAPRLRELHLHDNGGDRDQHLWPGAAPAGQGIDWPRLYQLTRDLPQQTSSILEIAHTDADTPESLLREARAFFDSQHRLAETVSTS